MTRSLCIVVVCVLTAAYVFAMSDIRQLMADQTVVVEVPECLEEFREPDTEALERQARLSFYAAQVAAYMDQHPQHPQYRVTILTEALARWEILQAEEGENR
jgi:hypothetical protein